MQQRYFLGCNNSHAKGLHTIITLEKLPEEVTVFEDAIWSSLVEYVTVNGKDDLRFTLVCGTEIKA